MQWWQILILAVIQGIAEFLPISSSGHLVIVSALFGYQPGELDVADINIVLHLGTLGSILIYYWREILRLLNQDRRVIPLLVLGTIPAAVIGILIKKKFEGLLESAMLAGWMLLLNGTILLLAARRAKGTSKYNSIGWRETLGIGFAQAFALLPGISRSGSTIAAGLQVGLDQSNAATFSFLLAIPAIAGAVLLELIGIISGDALSTPVSTLLVGAFVSFVVGLFALSLLNRWLQKGRLVYFAYWCWFVGMIVVVWQMTFA